MPVNRNKEGQHSRDGDHRIGKPDKRQFAGNFVRSQLLRDSRDPPKEQGNRREPQPSRQLMHIAPLHAQEINRYQRKTQPDLLRSSHSFVQKRHS